VSISYLSLSEATAVNFIAPTGAIMLTRYLEDNKIALLDVIASITALAGVVLVLQPSKNSTSLSGDPYAYHKGIVSRVIGVVDGIVSFNQ
jgi:drug/metabolite transporter (DMT)-like permease